MEPNMVYQNLMTKGKNLCVSLIFFEDSKTVACVSGKKLSSFMMSLTEVKKRKGEN